MKLTLGESTVDSLHEEAVARVGCGISQAQPANDYHYWQGRRDALAEIKKALSMKSTLTPDDLADWKAFERVRKSGRWNMYDPNARLATGLNGERYAFVMKNYAALKAAAAIDPTTNGLK